MSTTPAAPWDGIFPPMITPLSGQDELDQAGLERLIEHLIGGGVHGIFILGTTGEAPGLSYRLRRELIERTCRQVGRRVPVLVGVTDTAVVEALHISDFAAEHGASALVVAPPYYFPNSQPELVEYIQHLAPALPLPLFLYNMPSHTKTTLELETVRQAMELPSIVGLKDSSGNMTYFHHLLRLQRELRPDWSLLVGPEELLGESLILGGNGGVCGGANLFPRLYVAIYEAARRHDSARVAELHAKVIHISATLYRVGHHGSAIIKALKCALNLAGLCDDYMAEPFHSFREPERKKVLALVEELRADLGELG